MATNIFVFGASGHAKVVIDILEHMEGTKVAFAVDDTADAKGQAVLGYAIIGGRDELLVERARADAGFVAIGDNAARRDVATWLASHQFKLARAIHPAALLGRYVVLGAGTAVMAGCVINADTRLGDNVIVNTGATVDHDCDIGDCVHIAPGCHLCGGVTVGAGSLLGAGTIVIPAVHIGRNAVVGAGSTVTEDIPDNARVVGSPARPTGGLA